MFTGIIQEIAKIKRIERRGPKMRICLPIGDVELGDSVAVNGVCLTVDEITKEGAFFTVMGKTLSDTSLGRLKPGRPVNIERALKVGQRVSGHFVYGHICGLGRIVNVKKTAGEVDITIQADKNIVAKLKEKGSVAIDGISLTVQKVLSGRFSVSIVDHTLKNTALQFARASDIVNIEYELGPVA